MARATLTTNRARCPIEYRDVLTYTLTLDAAEAKALMDLTACIGGCPTNSRRKYFDAIQTALGKTGLRWRDLTAAQCGSLHFKDGEMIDG